MHKIIQTVLIIVAFSVGSAPALDAAWTSLLQEYVTAGTKEGIPLHRVDYDNLGADADFRGVVEQVEKTDPDELAGRDEKMAFWINVYNIAAIKMVLDHQPKESIRDIGWLLSPVWEKDAITINGQTYSLGHIEHDILRPMGDPRIHFAIVCASLSCPDLRKQAYSAEKLNEQLDKQTRDFLQNKVKGMSIKHDQKVVHLSSIFKWFKDDFGDESDILQFVFKYSDADVTGYTIQYLPYNWKLNSK